MWRFVDRHGAYAVVRCTGCGFARLNPRPSAETIGAYYEAGEYTPFLSSSGSVSGFGRVYGAVRRYSVRWKRRCIERVIRGGKVLDLGCGTGEFLMEMKQNGWTTCGVEPSMEASEFARRQYGLDVTTGGVDAKNLGAWKNRFDLVTMWHVLEHVHDLKPALQLIGDAMTKDGWLLVAVPNVGSYDARAYGRAWVALDPPRHLWHFTPYDMEKLAGQTGFVIRKRHHMPLDCVFNAIMSEAGAVSRRGKWFWPFGLARASWRMTASYFAGLAGNGSSMMYYLRKS